MKKEFRVKKNEEFQSILRKKKYVSNDCYVLYYQPRSQKNARVGISASKKLGNAVVRNKVKRQVRMMCQQLLQFDEAFDLIIIVRNKYLTKSYAENLSQLKTLLEKVKSRRT